MASPPRARRRPPSLLLLLPPPLCSAAVAVAVRLLLLCRLRLPSHLLLLLLLLLLLHLRAPPRPPRRRSAPTPAPRQRAPSRPGRRAQTRAHKEPARCSAPPSSQQAPARNSCSSGSGPQSHRRRGRESRGGPRGSAEALPRARRSPEAVSDVLLLPLLLRLSRQRLPQRPRRAEASPRSAGSRGGSTRRSSEPRVAPLAFWTGLGGR